MAVLMAMPVLVRVLALVLVRVRVLVRVQVRVRVLVLVGLGVATNRWIGMLKKVCCTQAAFHRLRHRQAHTRCNLSLHLRSTCTHSTEQQAAMPAEARVSVACCHGHIFNPERMGLWAETAVW